MDNFDKPSDNESPELPPPPKKMKTDKVTVIPVLEHDISSPKIQSRNVFTGVLKNKKDASNLLKNLPPLPSVLEHLKRIRKNQDALEIILGEAPISPDSPLVELFASISETTVPKLRPVSSVQFKIANELWPCNFHPDKETEKLLLENCGFGQEELEIISKNINIVLERFQVTGKQSCAIYDPTDKELVCIANSSPAILQHSAMSCLNILAEMQKDSRDKSDSLNTDNEYGEVLCQRTIRNKHSDYLCTGLDIYMSHEPCTMCAMALLHSRAKRLFFVNENKKNGSLMSVVKLHCVEGINHRFHVFQIKI